MMVPVIVMIGAGLTVIIAMIYDIRQGIIPNFLNIVSMYGGILFHTLWCQGVIWSVKGLAAGLCIFLLPYLLGGMGAGDVKLFGAMGTWLGWRGVLFTALFSAFSAGVMALAAIFLHGGRKGVGVRIYMARHNASFASTLTGKAYFVYSLRGDRFVSFFILELVMNKFRLLLKDEQGASAVEFALVLPFLLMILFMIFELIMAYLIPDDT